MKCLRSDITKNDIRIFLHKPNREGLGEITTFLEPKHKLIVDQVNELTFTLPYFTDKISFIDKEDVVYDDKVVNRYFDIIKEKYLLKVEWLGETEWYLINGIVKSGGNSGNEKEITAYSLPYELRGERFFNWDGIYSGNGYTKESLTIDEVTHSVTSNSLWQINHIDPGLFGMRRDFDFQNTTILEALNEIAKTYNAIIDFDTANRLINFYHQDNYGQTKGVYFSHDKYLKSIKNEVEHDNIITRLIPVGKDGLTINTMNPTGTDYLQDFSYYMQPFERDNENNVIKSSNWLSDSLCHTLLDYQSFYNSKEADYNALMLDYLDIQADYNDVQNEIDQLNNDLAEINNQIDIKQTDGEDTSEEESERNSILSQLTTLNDQLDDIEQQLKSAFEPIEDIIDALAFTTYFTPEQIAELTPFINTQIWESNNIANVEDLVHAGRERFNEVNNPSPIIRIGLVDLLKIADVNPDVKQLKLGDKITINYDVFDINVRSQIVEMNINYQSGSVDLVITNSRYISHDSDAEFTDMVKRSDNVSGSYLRNKNKIDQVSSVTETVNQFLNSGLQASRQEITAGVNESIRINQRGISNIESNNSNRYIRLTNGVIGLVRDGEHLAIAVSPDGVHASQLIGKIHIDENLIIENETQSYVINENGMELTHLNGNLRVSLNDQQGIKLEKLAGGQWIETLSTDTNGDLYISAKIAVGGNNNNRGTIDVLNNSNNSIININNQGLSLVDDTVLINQSGLLTSLTYHSSGEINGWQRAGYIDDVQTDAYINFNIPYNFTIVEAKLHIYSAPVVVHDEATEVDQYINLKDVEIYANNTYDGTQLRVSDDGTTSFINDIEQNITNDVWGNPWQPVHNGDVQDIVADITSFVENSENIFKLSSSTNEENNQSIIHMVAKIKGYQQ